MSKWGAVKAGHVLVALLRIGWHVAAEEGSHKRLERTGWTFYTFAFHAKEEIGPKMLARIAKKTGLRPRDL